ncbi:hypothetical protein D3C83_204400 [compost metagenome]
MRNVRALDNFLGASSAKKMADPRPNGTAIIKEIRDDTTVPYINGRAPKIS